MPIGKSLSINSDFMKNHWMYWLVKLTAAGILIQTLFFKFSGAAESVFIFQTLGVEPFGRIGSGVIELIAAVLILLPKKAWLGALMASMTMVGAVVSHLFVLGIEVQNDGGTLFILALITLLCSVIVLFVERHKWLSLLATTFRT